MVLSTLNLTAEDTLLGYDVADTGDSPFMRWAVAGTAPSTCASCAFVQQHFKQR